MALKHVRAFVAFHKKNPIVGQLFDRFAKEAIAAGHLHISSDMILHRIRWETSVVTRGAGTAAGSVLKINNNFSAYYARVWLKENPGYPDFFRTRTVKRVT